ncbi:NUDIX hydrolase [Actinotalea ferrariae]|uniref:NUDIX hydrolase n=1 Tax=Actinotalea ferrariae TaxID=1386098 RepID=UPI001C8BE92E|nr:NUDIX domain-containing protein [Actinotalea ferrariae]MBX9244752.1 NUDIX hydrolase [Actinotalea ferrariae]
MTPASRPRGDDARSEDARTVHAAGALVWRERAGRLEVALVHRPRYRDWSWPKGKLDPGEAVTAAGVREVAEEIGEQVVLGAPLPALTYRTEGRTKHVRYWAARLADDGDRPALAARPAVRPVDPTEIDDVVWVSTPTAADLLTRRTDRRPLATLVALHGRGRLATRPLAVVRHGQAVKRSDWSGTDPSRPLTSAGSAQSEALVPVLAAFGVRHVVTSPWARCLKTAAPYVEAAGPRLEQVDALTQAAHDEDPAGAAAVVRELLAQPEATALCTHRPVLRTVLGVLQDATRRWTAGELPQRDPWLRPGELVVTHLTREGRVVAVEQHRPPIG